ncbi:hypothetical protein BDW22DRAFT_1360659 [Trametopsis cervina]|nr:hypothetical protein BDW22DRAFT_1360659 [Trametopsis cervina]
MASTGGLHSLATIIKRLEAATSRLEDLAALGPAVPQVSGGTTVISSQSNEPTPVPPPPPPPPPPAAVPAAIPESVVAFDEQIIEGKLKPLVKLTGSFASQSVIDQVALIEKEFKTLRDFLQLVATCKLPDKQTLEPLLMPLSKDIEAVARAKEANRKDRDWNNHHTFLAEGAPAVGWVVVSPKPAPYVQSIKEATEFYGNRIIKEWKDKDPKHVEWVKGWYALFEELRKYVLDFHTTGLAWNAKGIPTSEYKSSGGAASAPGAPPPPPPPPPPAAPPAASASGGGVAAVFAELNRGEDVTKGLRKVDKSEMTHKNPSLRAGSTVPATTSSAAPKKPPKPTKPSALAGKKPAKFALEGNKWIIEYQENESALTVDQTELQHTVNLYGCKNSTIIVKGKVNAVTLVNCTKTSVLVESVISSVSVTSSPSFQLQITGSAPTVQLDSTDTGMLYLSKDCLATEITTAKCSAINISLPVEGEEDGIFNEHPIPEMFKTVIKDGKLVTTAVEHAG